MGDDDPLCRLREAEAYIDAQMSEMTQNLDMNIARLGDQLSQLRLQLGGGLFVDPHAEPKAVLDEFETVRSRLGHLEELSKTYSSMQKLFNITVYDYKNMRDARQLEPRFARRLWPTADSRRTLRRR